MRLIDADQFKENILSGLYIYCQENKEDIANAIDSEPTIITSLKLDNITEEDIEKFKMIWQRANSKGLLAFNEERPQGKWIYTDKEDKEKGYGGYCSVCKCDMPIGIHDWKQVYYESKFCPNCGAYMRGKNNGKEETT